jgi:peptidoglycan hydrolase-like protein with peptidoglycan-binding domain
MPVGGAGVTMAPAAQAELDPSWPIAGYTGPQPWQVQNPPALSHNRGFVVSGTAGDLVEELAAALARLGYETAISRGENPQAIYAESERAAVIRFQTDFGIKEDPAVLAVTTPDTVGPWTWEALFRLLRRVAG